MVISLAALVATACSQILSYEVESFLFDGVPDPEQQPPRATEAPEVPVQASMTGRRAAVQSMLASTGPKSVHKPYAETRCTQCHAPWSSSTGMHRLLEATPEQGLCLKCHASLLDARPLLHGPANAQACLICHNPHFSSRRFLLVDDVATLCRSCHSREDLMDSSAHAEVGTTPCNECHDPHGSKRRFFLKEHVR